MTDEEMVNSVKTAAEALWDLMKQVALESVKKQIPAGDPRKSWSNGAGYTDTFICPACEAHIHMPYLQSACDYNYCPYCGQRWEEDD